MMLRISPQILAQSGKGLVFFFLLLGVAGALGSCRVPESEPQVKRRVVVKARPLSSESSDVTATTSSDAQAGAAKVNSRVPSEILKPTATPTPNSVALELPLDTDENSVSLPPQEDSLEEEEGRLPNFARVYAKTVDRVVKLVVYRKGERPGLGTGFFFGGPNLILTNAHVVQDAQRVEVFTRDGQKVEGTVLGLDELTDVAVVRAFLKKPVLPLLPAPASRVKPGRWVLAIGNPLGLEFSATKGIISAVNRSEELWDQVGYSDFIQTDAAINQGNSGGPLVDRNGRVVGMCAALDKDANRIGFAIPMSMASVVQEHLVKYRKLKRSWLGIQILRRDGQIEVVGVVPESPAYKVGFQPGDVILQFDGGTVEDVEKLRWSIAIHGVEEPSRFVLARNGNVMELDLFLEEARELAQSDTGGQ